MKSLRTITFLAAMLAMAGFSVATWADVSAVVFEVQATNNDGTAVYQVSASDLEWSPQYDAWVWNLAEMLELQDAEGDIIGILSGGSVRYKDDPFIALGFSAQAGGSPTTFTFSSALLSFPTINPATATASAGLTLTDTGGNGALLTGNGWGGGSFEADYNNGTPFVSFIPSLSVPNGSTAGAGNQPSTLLGPVFNMQSFFAFTLSAEDLASGTSSFNVIPEPAALALLVLGLIARRR